MDRDKELLILDTALTCLLDSYVYEPEDFDDLDITEADIRDMIVSIFREQMQRKGKDNE
jgi:hypothetical protein